MKILITGTSSGIGNAIAKKFLRKGHEVHGFDIRKDTIGAQGYFHHICDVSDASSIPNISNIEILINNAGIQGSSKDIYTNLMGTINVTEAYLPHPSLVSILNISDVSGHNGAGFPDYVASKGGILAYTKNVAKRVSKWTDKVCTCNSISPGGVITESNKQVLNDPDKWSKLMSVTPLGKWASCEEIAEWAYFLTVINKSVTGQDIIIDNGETNNAEFIW